MRERFQDHLNDGLAFARYDPTADVSKIYRITDMLVDSNEVLLVIDPDPTSQTASSTHMTVADLLARLTALPPDYAEYALEACEPEIQFENDARIRYDYPIHGTGRDDALHLCLLAHIEQET